MKRTVSAVGRGGSRRRSGRSARRAVLPGRCVRWLLAVGTWLAASAAAADEPPRWQAGASLQLGYPGGYVQVGENQYPGDRLTLHHDLGVNLLEILNLDLGYHLTPRDSFHAALQMFFLDGSTTLPRDVFFNGAKLQGGTTLNTSTNFPEFFRATATYERQLLTFRERATLSASAGLTFVYLNFTVHGTLAPDTPGHETKEDFQTQELPIPLLGLRYDDPFTSRFDFFATLDGGYLPWVDSLRTEGGTVNLTQSQADAAVGLSYALTPSLSLEGAVAYEYIFQHEKSHEDDNLFNLSTIGMLLGARYRF
jgi:hypothetical protein